MGFHTSIMVDTSLSSLAQNLDAPDWPLKGKEETPAKYVDLTFEELQLMPGLSGHPERIEHLISILRETLAFDNPFGEMVEHGGGSAEKENPLMRNLAKLEISTEFPIAYTMVSADTKEFCRLEKITTLGEFAAFAQSMPPQVIVGGDFRRLLNALAHIDEESLATILPFRRGAKGLHLAEALGQLVGALAPGEAIALYKRFGGRLSAQQEEQMTRLSREELKQAENDLREQADDLFGLFKEELDALKAGFGEAGALEHFLAVLGDPLRETVAAKLLEPVLRTAAKPLGSGAPAKKGGLSGLLSRLFKK